MAATDLYSVTVSRINEGLHDDPYFTMDVYRITVEEDGTLTLTGTGGGKSFSAMSWDGFETKRLGARRR